MSLAIAILADVNLHRVEQLTNILLKQDVNICIHVDQGAEIDAFRKLRSSLRGAKNVIFANRGKCDWGDFSLVDAELRMCADIFSKWPETTHVQLISGDSLPVRPMHELKQLLKENENVDFIESVLAQDDNWIAGGLGIERFTLHFPFSWKTQRRRFDALVRAQRILKIQRKIPRDLQPYIGSQWWCLTRRTLDSIMSDPDRPAYDRYFKGCWVPDESYFQTLVRKHAHNIQSRSLLYSHFDHQGKPTTFYDDHVDHIGELKEFFIRKVWVGADMLYETCETEGFPKKSTAVLSEKILQADDRRKLGRSGLRMQGRAPNNWHEKQPATAAPYYVFSGFDVAFADFDEWITTRTERKPHGRLFSKTGVHFRNEEEIGPGGLSSNPKIRDVEPIGFLGNLIWQTRNENPAFHLGVDDCEKTIKYMSQDPNAKIYHIQYGWLLDLMKENIENFELLRRKAGHLAERERIFLEMIQGPKATCTATVCLLRDVFESPATVMAGISSDVNTQTGPAFPIDIPILAAPNPVIDFAHKLKDLGINISTEHVEKRNIGSQASVRKAVQK